MGGALSALGIQHAARSTQHSEGAVGLIDCHAHLMPPALMDPYRILTASTYFGANMWSDPGFTEIERHIEMMDRYGVETEVLEYGAFIPPAARAARIPMVDAVRLVNE